jgi:hypothetical protein
MSGKKGMRGENLGGAGRGQGRHAIWFKAVRGQTFIHERETIGGEIYKPELWRVLSVSEDEIEFQCGDDIIVIRKPEEDD